MASTKPTSTIKIAFPSFDTLCFLRIVVVVAVDVDVAVAVAVVVVIVVVVQ